MLKSVVLMNRVTKRFRVVIEDQESWSCWIGPSLETQVQAESMVPHMVKQFEGQVVGAWVDLQEGATRH